MIHKFLDMILLLIPVNALNTEILFHSHRKRGI